MKDLSNTSQEYLNCCSRTHDQCAILIMATKTCRGHLAVSGENVSGITKSESASEAANFSSSPQEIITFSSLLSFGLGSSCPRWESFQKCSRLK